MEENFENRKGKHNSNFTSRICKMDITDPYIIKGKSYIKRTVSSISRKSMYGSVHDRCKSHKRCENRR